MTPVEWALEALGINPDHEREDEGAYLTSVIDLRPTGANYVYVTVCHTDNGDSEKVSVIRLTYAKPHYNPIVETILEGEY